MSRKHENPWEPQQEQLRQMWLDGVPIEEIGRRLNRTLVALINRVHMMKLPLNRDNVDFTLVTDFDPAQILLDKARRTARSRHSALNVAIGRLRHEQWWIGTLAEQLEEMHERLMKFVVDEEVQLPKPVSIPPPQPAYRNRRVSPEVLNQAREHTNALRQRDFQLVREFVANMQGEMTILEIREALKKRLFVSRSLNTVQAHCETLSKEGLVERFHLRWGKHTKDVVIRLQPKYPFPAPLQKLCHP